MTLDFQRAQAIWVAEHVPGYQLRRTPLPTELTAEEQKMSAPYVIGRDLTYADAVKEVVRWIHGLASMKQVQQAGERQLLLAGADVIMMGAGSVELGARIYRVRRVGEA